MSSQITEEQILYRGPIYFENSRGILTLGKVLGWYQQPRGKKRQLIYHYQILDIRTDRKIMVPIAVCFRTREEFDKLTAKGKMQRPRNGTMSEAGSFQQAPQEKMAA